MTNQRGVVYNLIPGNLNLRASVDRNILEVTLIWDIIKGVDKYQVERFGDVIGVVSRCNGGFIDYPPGNQGYTYGVIGFNNFGRTDKFYLNVDVYSYNYGD